MLIAKMVYGGKTKDAAKVALVSRDAGRGSDFLRLDAAEKVFLEVSRSAEKLVLGRGHGELVGEFLLDQAGRTDQVGNLEEFVSDGFDALGEFNGRQEARRENSMKKVGNWRLAAIVVDLDAVEFPQFGVAVPERRKLALDFVHDLLGGINELFVDDESVIGEVRLAHKAHHEREYLCSEFPAQDGKVIRLPDDWTCVKAHTFNSETAYASVKFIGQEVDGLRLVVKDHREKIEARGGIRLVQHPGFVDENAQYSLVQSAPSENISDGNRFSSLKAKNILRFSVIPSFRKTSRHIIANSDVNGKWGRKIWRTAA